MNKPLFAGVVAAAALGLGALPAFALDVPPAELEACHDELGSVYDIVADQLELQLADVGPESNLREDLQADSLAIVELALAVEARFGVKLPDGACEELRTVGDLCRLIAIQRAE